jgi:hypothetical protein
MTIETRTTMELGDIQTFEFECKNCHKISSWPISETKHIPVSCECGGVHGTQWMPYGGDTHAALTGLMNLINRFAGANEPFNIRFGVKGLEMRKSS